MSHGYITHHDGYSLEAAFYAGRRRSRRRGQAVQEPYRATSFSELRFDKIIAPENLLSIWKQLKRSGGKGPGVDGKTYDDYSIAEAAQLLRETSEAIRLQRYRPQPTRLVRIPKGDGRGWRELRLPTVIDRTVAKAVELAISQPCDALLGEHVYGFRPRRGVMDMLVATEYDMRRTGAWTIVQDDIRDAFPSAGLDQVMEAFRAHLGHGTLTGLIERALRGPNGQHTQGLDQGNPLAPLALNLLLHEALDRQNADQHNPPLRYADNLVATGRGVTEGRSNIQQLEEQLQPIGMALKHQDQPADLNQPNSRATVLGYEVKRGPGGMELHVPEGAWRDLCLGLEETHERDNPIEAAHNMVRGWANHYGAAFESEDARVSALRRITRIAAEADLPRTTSQRDRLMHALEGSRNQWDRKRQRCFSHRGDVS